MIPFGLKALWSHESASSRSAQSHPARRDQPRTYFCALREIGSALLDAFKQRPQLGVRRAAFPFYINSKDESLH
jgi:hypothetical protein